MNENEYYVIILESDVNNPDWEYVARKDTRAEIEAVEEYSPDDRQTVSRKKYDGDRKGPKKVKITNTGDDASGYIYKLTKKEEEA